MNFFEKVKTNSVLKIIHISHGHRSSVDYGIQHFTYHEEHQHSRTQPLSAPKK
jgi:hypothetical protein